MFCLMEADPEDVADSEIVDPVEAAEAVHQGARVPIKTIVIILLLKSAIWKGHDKRNVKEKVYFV